MKKVSETKASVTEASVTVLTPPVSDQDHAQGLATADITVVEYGDYNSEPCATLQPWIRAMQTRLGNKLRFVFRHFPAEGLPLHAAEAAEAAGRQGQFWEMHDTLFANPFALGNGYLVEYAGGLGLDISRFLRDMTGGVSRERIRLDRMSGAQSGVQETPAFFVNGIRQHGSWEGSTSWEEGFRLDEGSLLEASLLSANVIRAEDADARDADARDADAKDTDEESNVS